MSVSGAVSVLRRTAAFGGLGDDRLNVLAFSGERTSFAPGDRLAEGGETPPRCLVVLEGTVLVQSVSGDQPDGVVGRGATIGEIALVTNQPSDVSVTAESAGEVLIITRPLFERLVADFPDIAVQLRDAMRARLGNTLHQLGQLEQRLRGVDGRAADRNERAPARGRRDAPSRAPPRPR
jgi:CRP-like cAMP-binding protein